LSTKRVIAIAALAAFSDIAHAQSSVTLYGIIDMGLNYVTNDAGKANWTLTSGVILGNRWGLKGIEDLGGGLKAIFQLENGFTASNGALGNAGRLFGRQAWVGLSSNAAGMLTLGRQYDMVFDFVMPMSGTIMYVGFSHPFDNDRLLGASRINNSIKYTSADYRGFRFGGMYGFSNEASTGSGTGFADNRAWSVGAGYAVGALRLGAGYVHLTNPNAGIAGAIVGDYQSVAPVGLTGAVTRQDVVAVGATYAIGRATLGAMYSHSRFDTHADGLKFDNFEGSTRYQVTPELAIAGAYTFTSGRLDSTGARPKYHQVSLIADYFLSKRTDVYLSGAYERAAGDAGHAVISPDTFGAGGTMSPDASSSQNQAVIRIGIRTKF
jgi:general bacterial porin, GBP family